MDNRYIERAKLLAKERGVPYQRYLRELIGLALDAEERREYGQRVADASAGGPPTLSALPGRKRPRPRLAQS
jgi:hypothetical protein